MKKDLKDDDLLIFEDGDFDAYDSKKTSKKSSKNSSKKSSKIGSDSSKKTKNSKKKSKKRKMSKKKKGIIIAIVVVLAVLFLAFGFVAKQNIDYLKGRANDLKTELFTVVECIKNNNPDEAENAMVKVREISDNISENLGFTFWSVMSKLPIAGDDVASVKELLSILDDADKVIITPFISEIRNNPFGEIKSGNGINLNVLYKYLDFAEKISDDVVDMANRMDKIEFKLVKLKSIEEYKIKFAELGAGFAKIDECRELLNAIAPNGEDSAYMIMAQNTAEIRSCGGFPGACGLLVVKDGILEMKDFGPVEDYISYGSPVDTGTTAEEGAIFGGDYLYQDRDASYNPHFPKVASITKISFENKTGKKIDGIVSLTPAVIQEILGVTGDELTLEDGTKVTKDNAMQVTQHDLYYKYNSLSDGVGQNDAIVNALFAQTASLTMESMTRNMNFESLLSYLNLFENGFKDRTIMLWSDKESSENTFKKYGASGSLNYETEKPQTGIFFSNWIASKLGMFVEIDYNVGEPVKNEKGQYEYQVEAKIKNTATEEDLNVSSYVKGNMNGALSSYIFLFAPKGGTISNVVYDNGVETNYGNIYGLDVAYVQQMAIEPGDTVTINYTVSTAIGVDTPLEVVKTPTMR